MAESAMRMGGFGHSGPELLSSERGLSALIDLEFAALGLAGRSSTAGLQLLRPAPWGQRRGSVCCRSGVAL